MSNFDCNLPIKDLLQSYKPSIVKYLENMEPDGNAPVFNNDELSLFLPQMINDTIEFSTDATEDEIKEYSEKFDDLINDKLSSTDKDNVPALGVGSFYGLNTIRTIKNEDVGNKSYESLYGGETVSYDDAVDALNKIGIDLDLDGYEAQFSKDENGEDVFNVFVKENIDGSREFLKVITPSFPDGVKQVVQTIIPVGQEYGITNVYDYSYLKDNYENTDTIENNIKTNSFAEINEIASNSLSETARVDAYAKLFKEASEWDLSNEQFASELNKFIVSIDVAQQKQLNEMQQQYDASESDEGKSSIFAQMRMLNTNNTIELNQYNLKLYQYESKLPEDVKNQLYDYYTELSSADNKDDRSAITMEILNIINSTDMTKEEKVLNYQQIGNCVFAAQSYETASLLSVMENCTDDKELEELNDKFKENVYNLNKEMYGYQMEYNFASSNLTSSQISKLKKLYTNLTEASSKDERDKIISDIRTTEEKYSKDLNYSIGSSEMVIEAVKISQSESLLNIKDQEEIDKEKSENSQELVELYKYYS